VREAFFRSLLIKLPALGNRNERRWYSQCEATADRLTGGRRRAAMGF